MKHAGRSTLLALLFVCVLVFGLTLSAMAAPIGTPAGTNLTNTATINYDVGGNPQPPETTNTLTLETDRKLDVLVDEFSNATQAVSPGDTAATMTGGKCLGFNVTNESNATLDIPLTLNQTGTTDPFGGTDNFDIAILGNCEIRLDDGDNTCETSASDSTITKLDDLASGSTSKVWVTCTISNAQVDGDLAAVSLLASFAETTGVAIPTDDNGNADIPGTVDDVFADGECLSGALPAGHGCDGNDAAYDGKHSDTDSFEIASADLTVAKTSVVYSDPVNGVSADAKAIPGAVITYTITVTNNGSANAENVVVTDDLTTMVDAGYLAFKTEYDDAGTNCAAGYGIVVSTASSAPAPVTCETNAGSDDSADYNITTVKTVTATIGTVASGGGVQTVKFQVTVQ
ncbi:MAG: DUF11 domain-containing protein [Nitrospirae bacterium]|nr:DUF11 domain-containing protein [Nitrospirota bacterium]